MKAKFRSLIAEIDALPDKDQALIDIKSKKWPLSNKPIWYHESGKSITSKNLEKTMQINHFVKSYLYLLTNG